MSITTYPHPAPLASPVSLVHPVDGGIALHIFGGLSPLQHVAALVAPAFVGECPRDERGTAVVDIRAKGAVEFAAAILDACDDYEHARRLPVDGPQPTVEPDADLTPQPVSPIITE